MATLENFSLLIAAGSSIFGILWETRKDKAQGGGLTRWGKASVWLAVLSGALTIYLHAAQERKNDENRQKAEAALKVQLNEIERTVYATNGIWGAFAIAYPLDVNGQSRYGARMKTYANKWASGDRSLGQIPRVSTVAGDATGKHLRVLTFSSTSPVAPDPMREPDEALAFDQSSVSVGVYRQNGGKSRNPDLELRIAPGDNPFVWEEAYDPVQHSVTVWTGLVRLEHVRNSSVRSVEDFVGARLHIEVPHDEVRAGTPGGPSYSHSYDTDKVANLMKRARINWVMLDFADWETICLAKDDLKEERSGQAYEVHLPDSIDELSTKFRDTSKCEVQGWEIKRNR